MREATTPSLGFRMMAPTVGALMIDPGAISTARPTAEVAAAGGRSEPVATYAVPTMRPTEKPASRPSASGFTSRTFPMPVVVFTLQVLRAATAA